METSIQAPEESVESKTDWPPFDQHNLTMASNCRFEPGAMMQTNKPKQSLVAQLRSARTEQRAF